MKSNVMGHTWVTEDGLTHFSQEIHKGYLANSADPDKKPQKAVSDQGLHCIKFLCYTSLHSLR